MKFFQLSTKKREFHRGDIYLVAFVRATLSLLREVCMRERHNLGYQIADCMDPLQGFTAVLKEFRRSEDVLEGVGLRETFEISPERWKHQSTFLGIECTVFHGDNVQPESGRIKALHRPDHEFDVTFQGCNVLDGSVHLWKDLIRGERLQPEHIIEQIRYWS